MIKVCEYCGKEFEQRFGREKFCSQECGYKSRKLPPIKKTCEMCGKEFEIKRSGGNRKQKFCSTKCSTKHVSKVLTVHEWITVKCEECGKEMRVKDKPNRKRFCGYKCSNAKGSKKGVTNE